MNGRTRVGHEYLTAATENWAALRVKTQKRWRYSDTIPLTSVSNVSSPSFVFATIHWSASSLCFASNAIPKRAGFKPWPKLWHNLRASCETEWMREFDLATACKWIGNSPKVAAQHYAMSMDLGSDFAKAAGRVLPQNPPQQTAESEAISEKRKENPKAPLVISAGGLPSLSIVSPQLLHINNQTYGRYRIRTCDLMRVMHAL